MLPNKHPDSIDSFYQLATHGYLNSPDSTLFWWFFINKVLSMSYIYCYQFQYGLQQIHVKQVLLSCSKISWLKSTSACLPHIVLLGWLFRTHKDFSLLMFKQLLHITVKALAKNQSPSIQFGLTYRQIFNGTSCRFKKSLSTQIGLCMWKPLLK